MGVRVLGPKEVYTIVKTMYDEGYRVGCDVIDPRHWTKHKLLQDKIDTAEHAIECVVQCRV